MISAVHCLRVVFFMCSGFFHGYSLITTLMIINHALSGIAISMVMKYADNIVKVYSTSVAMVLTAVVSVAMSGFHLSLVFYLGSICIRRHLSTVHQPAYQRSAPIHNAPQDGHHTLAGFVFGGYLIWHLLYLDEESNG